MSKHIFVGHVNKEQVKSVECNTCGIKLPDSVQLKQHKEQEHFLSCRLCDESSFTTRQALREHELLCNDANHAGEGKEDPI